MDAVSRQSEAALALAEVRRLLDGANAGAADKDRLVGQVEQAVLSGTLTPTGAFATGGEGLVRAWASLATTDVFSPASAAIGRALASVEMDDPTRQAVGDLVHLGNIFEVVTAPALETPKTVRDGMETAEQMLGMTVDQLLDGATPISDATTSSMIPELGEQTRMRVYQDPIYGEVLRGTYLVGGEPTADRVKSCKSGVGWSADYRSGDARINSFTTTDGIRYERTGDAIRERAYWTRDAQTGRKVWVHETLRSNGEVARQTVDGKPTVSRD